MWVQRQCRASVFQSERGSKLKEHKTRVTVLLETSTSTKPASTLIKISILAIIKSLSNSLYSYPSPDVPVSPRGPSPSTRRPPPPPPPRPQSLPPWINNQIQTSPTLPGERTQFLRVISPMFRPEPAPAGLPGSPEPAKIKLHRCHHLHRLHQCLPH